MSPGIFEMPPRNVIRLVFGAGWLATTPTLTVYAYKKTQRFPGLQVYQVIVLPPRQLTLMVTNYILLLGKRIQLTLSGQVHIILLAASLPTPSALNYTILLEAHV